VKLDDDEETESSEHLGRAFDYVARRVNIEVSLSSELVLGHEFLILCVADWGHSPFILINPQRVALTGRGLFLGLKPGIQLDFTNHQTGIYSPPHLLK